MLFFCYRCSKELNQWDSLLEYSKLHDQLNPLLILDSAWHIPDWQVMSEALSCVDNTFPKEFLWKVLIRNNYLFSFNCPNFINVYKQKLIKNV